MGSQISKLEDFTVGLLEAMQIYAAIISHGFNLDHIDVGGGLAVDYASQQDASYFSKTYSIQDYADTVVNTITNFCKSNRLEIPTVFTENGRALTAHHAMLMTNVIETDSQNHQLQEISSVQLADQTLADISEKLIQSLTRNELISESLANSFATHLKDKFLAGEVNLEQRAWAEALLQQSYSALVKSKQINVDHNDDMSGAVSSMDKYYCNFSVFQSMPDVWGLEQVFPIVPLSRLDEAPSKQTRLHDLTCDSDGQISQYAVDGVMRDYLPLHEVSPKQEYLLGFFLLGAYQEVLGDIHNLFGDTHAINVEQGEQGQLQFTELEIGDCVNELLDSVHLDGEQIIKRCQDRLQSVSTRDIGTEQIFDEIKNALFGYTYLDSIDRPAHRIKR
jgi:arginine decarboxylase